MPPAMEAILREGSLLMVLFAGTCCYNNRIFNFWLYSGKIQTGCVITGFEPADILQSVLMLIRQVNKKAPSVQIQYKRAVKAEGNSVAQRYLSEVFEPCNAYWRGFGIIPLSGLDLRTDFSRYNAEKMIPVRSITREDNELCICGEILRVLKTPAECPLLGISVFLKSDRCLYGLKWRFM